MIIVGECACGLSVSTHPHTLFSYLHGGSAFIYAENTNHQSQYQRVIYNVASQLVIKLKGLAKLINHAQIHADAYVAMQMPYMSQPIHS